MKKQKIKVRKETDPFGKQAPVRRERGTCPPPKPEGLPTTPPNRVCLTASGKLMRSSAVAYVLFLCDRPKPHATPMQVQVLYILAKLVLLTMGPVSTG